jgi:hypothetical protein
MVIWCFTFCGVFVILFCCFGLLIFVGYLMAVKYHTSLSQFELVIVDYIIELGVGVDYIIWRPQEFLVIQSFHGGFSGGLIYTVTVLDEYIDVFDNFSDKRWRIEFYEFDKIKDYICS